MSGDDWRDDAFFTRRPTEQSFAWVARSIGKASCVVGHRRLTGGANSVVHRLTVAREGTRTSVVLRQYPPGHPPLRTALEAEIAHLRVVAHSGLPVPILLAADVGGVETSGAPSLLMSRLPGRVHLNPSDRGPWIEELATVAARVHAVDLSAPTFRPWTDSWITPRDRFRVPIGAQEPAVWRAAFEAMQTPPPEDRVAFLHGDYLPVNLLWSRGRISGLTDWNSLYRGSPAVDVGQCRRYLASLYSASWAEELGARYEAITGEPLHPWWDLYALLHHHDGAAGSIARQVAGRRPLDASGVTSRVETVVSGALRRLR